MGLVIVEGKGSFGVNCGAFHYNHGFSDALFPTYFGENLFGFQPLQ